MLLAQMRLIGEELIAGAALAVQHIFPHHALFHQLFQRPVNCGSSHRRGIVLQVPHQLCYSNMPALAVLQKKQDIIPLFCLYPMI